MGEPLRPDQLDRAVDVGLAHAGADTSEMSTAAFDAGRRRVLAAIRDTGITRPAAAAPHDPPRAVTPRRRWLLAAASVAVLVSGALIGQSIDIGGSGPVPRAAAEVLRQAADLAVTVKDSPVGPGQYRYVAHRGMGITLVQGGGAYTGELITTQTWIPADPRQVWFERRGAEGEPRWLPGLDGDGPLMSMPPGMLGEWTARCGAFGYWSEPSRVELEPECDRGSWRRPTAAFLAGLPSDPRQLYERLVKDNNIDSADIAAVLSEVGAVLGTGMVPAEYRARLYRMLEQVPGLQVTDESVNLDGREGVAVGVRRGKDFMEIIIDPDSGEYIGTRYVVAEEDHGLEPGMVRTFTATSMAVVDAPWAVPPR